MTTIRQMRALSRIAWRESRTARRRLLLYMSSISLGVAALVAIDSFSENVIRSVHDQSRSLMGGDVEMMRRDTNPAPVKRLLDSLATAGYGITRSTNFPSMALVPRTGGTRLVQVRALGRGYPFYGTVVTDPGPAWSTLHDGPNAVVDPAILVGLDAHVGDTLSLGYETFIISGALKSVPGDVGVAQAIAPRVYISDRYLPQTGLVTFGSRVEYQTLFKLNGTLNGQRFVARFWRRLLDMPPGTGAVTGGQAEAPPSQGRGVVRTAGYNESRLAGAIDSLHDYLAVVGLVALLLGGIGVASGVHAFVMRKIDPVAILRCLGATSWQVLTIYTLQAALMGLIGAAAGAVLGVGIQFVMPLAFASLLPVDVTVRVEPAAIGLGLAIGVWVALVFALRPLVALRRVSPLQALRRESDAEALRRARWDPLGITISLATVASVFLLGMSRANTLQRGVGFSVAIAVAIAALWASAAGLSWAARRALRPSWSFVLRQGIASLYRPGNQTRAVVLSLGFGVFLMGTLYQIQHNLLNTMSFRLSEARANVVFFDVQQEQRAGVDSIVRASRTELIGETPMINMRIASINGRPVAELMADTTHPRRAPWVLRREFRSTYRDTLTSSEHLVAGTWFSPTRRDTIGEVSLDQDVAKELRVTLGNTIVWNVQGVMVPTRVTSLREVKWASFTPNFFAVFDTRSLTRAPKQFVILGRGADARAVAQLQRDVVKRFPSVSSLDLTLVQQTVTNVLGKVTMAIRFLALISLGLGIPVLFSAVAATRRERLREGVLLKTLGATRRQIGRIMFAEYALLGALGALTGVVLSTLGAWALMHWIFRSPFTPALGPAALVALAMIALTLTIGLLTGREVFAETPMAALREA